MGDQGRDLFRGELPRKGRHLWEQVSGPGATEAGGAANPTLQFTAPSLADFLNESDRYKWQLLPVSWDDTKMTFKLTVTDGSGNSDAATLIVYVQDDSLEIHRSSGLPNVGIGTTVYLSGPDLKANTNSASTAITAWSWTLSRPSGSSAAFLDTGGTSSSIQFPRFIPDASGLYTVAYSSVSGASGQILMNAAEWVGVGTVGGAAAVSPQCANCHDGSIQPDRVTAWSATKHASLFEDSMDTYAGLAPEPYLWEFHTVGYDADAPNDGFDDLARANDFTFPEEGMSFSDFVADFPTVAKLANVQCENCHGPGSQHAGDPLRIAHSASQFGTCGQCHIQETQWVNSGHNSTGVVHGRGVYQTVWVSNAGCVRCHSGLGFKHYLEEGEEGLAAVTETGAFPGITCAACHDPHDATNEHQLRAIGNVAMIIDNATVNAGKAAVCYSCHDGNYAFGETDCDSDENGLADAPCATTDQTATQYWRQVHYNPQGPVLEGKGVLTDLNGDGTADLTLTENSFHSGSSFILSEVTGDATLPSSNDKCVTCHMATGPSVEEAGHLHLLPPFRHLDEPARRRQFLRDRFSERGASMKKEGFLMVA